MRQLFAWFVEKQALSARESAESTCETLGFQRCLALAIAAVNPLVTVIGAASGGSTPG